MTSHHRKKQHELLAPAGWFDALEAALQSGADAVYFGIKGLNMRATARNFKLSELREVVDRCNERGAKAYLALNCMIYENEVKGIYKVMEAAARAGIHGVICWDMAVAEAARQVDIPIHLSTQASTANASAVAHFHRTLGVKRFVLARELTLAHIKRLIKGIKSRLWNKSREIELETFVHGAMCVSVSGRCYLSQFLHGRSANRGECLQPCRRPYIITDPQTGRQLVMEATHLLSPKDLCTLPFLERILDTGIYSLKIEGRNRKADYVAVVTRAYRRALDFYEENRHLATFPEEFARLKAELMKELDSVFHRGFSSGFYHGAPMAAWTRSDGNESPFRREFCGKVVNFYRRISVAEIALDSRELRVGETIIVEGKTTGALRQQISSLQIDHAPVTQAPKGVRVACKVDSRVRPGDRVFVLTRR